MRENLVSIIIPNYNCKDYIEETLKSVLDQDYKNWEILLVDDCSTDGSYEIALSYSQKYPNIKVFRMEQNSGAARCRNLGIENAQGKYIAFLDSDDLWTEDKLQKQIRFMEKNNYDFTFTEYEQINEKSKKIGRRIQIPKKVSYEGLLYHDYIGCLTAIYNQESLGKVYSHDIKKNNDYSLFLNVLKKSKYVYGLKEILGFYRIRQGSISRNKWATIKPHYHLLRNLENQSTIKTLFCIFSHVVIKKIYKEKFYKEKDKKS